jgi:hypothetical protein
MKIIKRFSLVLTIMAVIIGLFSSAAHATTTADFTSTWSGAASANAEATAVAYADADAGGKVFLQEFRAIIPQSIQDQWKTPTREQLDKNGTIVHSLAEAQAVITTQAEAYKHLVTKTQVKIKALKYAIKHATSAHDKKKFRSKLKKAKKKLHAIYVDADWKYRPLVGLARGVCFTNTGLRGLLNAFQQFKECVDGDKKVVWIGYSPVKDEMRIVAVEKMNGTIVPGCLNIPELDIPPGTPDVSQFIIVHSFAEVQLKVSVSVHVVGDLSVHGVMMQDGTVCDEDTQVKHIDKMVEVPPVMVSATDADSAMAIGQHQVQANAQARAEVQLNVQAAIQFEVSQTMHLECASTVTLSLDRPNDVDQSIAHPGGTTDWSFTPDTGHAVAAAGAGNVTYTISADYGTAKFITANSPCATNGLHNNVVQTLTLPSGTYNLQICYIASTENPPNGVSYVDTITLTAVLGGQTTQVSQPITVNATPGIPG